LQKQNKPDRTMTRLAICAVISAAVVYAAEGFCQGKNWPLWEKYGPWILDNKLQTIAILAAVLYTVSLAVWPEGESTIEGQATEDFEPCL